MTDPRPRRREALIRLLEEQGLDGLVVDGGSNIRYLTGFTGSSALVLAARQRTVLVTDFRYATQAPAETGSAVDVRIERADVREGLRQSIGALGLRRVGFDRGTTTIAGLEALREQGGVDWVATTGLVAKLRIAKDAVEIAAVREAVRLALEALEAVIPFIRVGRTELDIAAELEAALRRRGSEWHPFQSIVAAGPRSALPHARSTARAVAPGELLVVDFGAQVDGYCSDITRTFVVGRAPDDRQREVYGVVQQAQARALGGLRAGMSGREADCLAR
ncbi:MAG: M24 family metallopeptidase, partial [Gemmatimonadales bacterium]